MEYIVPRHTVEYKVNWEKNTHPFFTIITAVYNRPWTIERTMRSVENQTFRNIEYILVDDGSVESNDDKIKAYMDTTELPVIFIKKANGGPHTAWNLGIEYARGEMMIILDSDDELLPNACGIFFNTWQSIPQEQRAEYAQMKALCMDGNGKLTCPRFPANVNELPKEKAIKYFSVGKGEQLGCQVTSVMKEKRWPEPEGITIAGCNIVWMPLERQYRTWGINEVVRVFHVEEGEHASGTGSVRRSIQFCKNVLWDTITMLNQSHIYCIDFLHYLRFVMRYCIMVRVLRNIDDEFLNRYKPSGTRNKFWVVCVWPTSLFGLWLYRKRYEIVLPNKCT